MPAVSMPAVTLYMDVSGEGCHPEWWDIGLNSCTLIASGRKKIFSLFVFRSVRSEGKGYLLFLSLQKYSKCIAVAKTNNLSPERLSLKFSLTTEKQYLHCAQFLIV